MTAREIAVKIGPQLVGSCNSVEAAIEYVWDGEYETDDVLLELATHCRIEMCADCNWWEEICHLTVDGCDYVCEDCMKDRKVHADREST